MSKALLSWILCATSVKQSGIKPKQREPCVAGAKNLLSIRPGSLSLVKKDCPLCAALNVNHHSVVKEAARRLCKSVFIVRDHFAKTAETLLSVTSVERVIVSSA